jgi:DNA polymerase III epsilon subunit-like protein
MTITPANAETYISVDVESAGPNPSQYSLLAIGACSVLFPDRNFYIELKPVNQLFRPEALESCGFSLEKLSAEGVDPTEAMRRFETWLQEASLPVYALFSWVSTPPSIGCLSTTISTASWGS